MTKMLDLAKRFRDDEDGAAMVEYSILIGIIAGAVILAIVAIGGWVSGRFTGLCSVMNSSGIGTCNATSGTGT